MASAGPTPICRWSHNTECHGATLDPSTETGSTWSFLEPKHVLFTRSYHTCTDKNKRQHSEKLEHSQSLLKMICLQATDATLLLGHGTTCMRLFRNQLLLPLGGRPRRNATGMKRSVRSWFLLLLQSMLLLLKTSAHQLRRPSQQSDQPGAKYSRESKKMGQWVLAGAH